MRTGIDLLGLEHLRHLLPCLRHARLLANSPCLLPFPLRGDHAPPGARTAHASSGMFLPGGYDAFHLKKEWSVRREKECTLRGKEKRRYLVHVVCTNRNVWLNVAHVLLHKSEGDLFYYPHTVWNEEPCILYLDLKEIEECKFWRACCRLYRSRFFAGQYSFCSILREVQDHRERRHAQGF